VSKVQKNVTLRVFSKVLITDETPHGDGFMNLNAAKQTENRVNIQLWFQKRKQFLE
jgi:hypothetical protein